MPRIRAIKPDFFKSVALSGLPVTARLTFAGLWCYCDDDGRGVDDPRLVKAEVWPLDDNISVKKVDLMLQKLADAWHIHRYTQGGRSYFHVINWNEHQRINRPRPSRLPACPTCVQVIESQRGEESWRTHDTITEDSVNDHGALTVGKEGKGRERNEERKGHKPSSSSRPVVVEKSDDEVASLPEATALTKLARRDLDKARKDGINVRVPPRYLAAARKTRIEAGDRDLLRNLAKDNPEAGPDELLVLFDDLAAPKVRELCGKCMSGNVEFTDEAGNVCYRRCECVRVA